MPRKAVPPMRGFLLLLAFAAGLAGGLAQAAGHGPERVRVGYFPQWPTPSQFSQIKQTYDYALRVEVAWLPFTDGDELNAALAAGEIDIAYAHGQVPFVVGVSRGLELTGVGIAVGYSGDDNCILRTPGAVGRDITEMLIGGKVAVEAGGITHFRLLRMLDRLGVDASQVEIVAVERGADAAAALRRGEVVMACAYGAALRSMQDLGAPLMRAAELEAMGLKVFDLVTVRTEFMRAHPDLVQAFMDVTEATNVQWRKDPTPMTAAIARAAGMDPDSARQTLSRFDFPPAAEQKSEAWLGAAVPAYLKEIADFFVAQGRLPEALDSYEPFVTTRFLR